MSPTVDDARGDVAALARTIPASSLTSTKAPPAGGSTVRTEGAGYGLVIAVAGHDTPVLHRILTGLTLRLEERGYWTELWLARRELPLAGVAEGAGPLDRTGCRPGLLRRLVLRGAVVVLGFGPGQRHALQDLQSAGLPVVLVQLGSPGSSDRWRDVPWMYRTVKGGKMTEHVVAPEPEARSSLPQITVEMEETPVEQVADRTLELLAQRHDLPPLPSPGPVGFPR